MKPHVNISLTEPQQEIVKEFYGTMTNKKLAEKIGVSYAKLMNNLRMMDIQRVQGRKVKEPVSFGKNFSWEWAAANDCLIAMS